MSLELRPFYLAGIMHGSSNSPPGMVPLKARYNNKDLVRISHYYQIPLKRPSVGAIVCQCVYLSH